MGDAVTLDHIGELPEVREYEHLHDTHYYDGEDGPDTGHRLADAALAAADREVGRLKEKLTIAFRLYLQRADADLVELLAAEQSPSRETGVETP
jgi:hypothetical protein